MKTKKTYAIFGLGRYGTAVARELVENGMEVIAVDTEQRLRMFSLFSLFFSFILY